MDPEPKIRKPRSLQTNDPLYGAGGPNKKHFKLSGAAPTDAPSQGTVKHRDKRICQRSPDHAHHYEVVCEHAWYWYERMIDQCIHCGHKKGWGFEVWTRPKPEWRKKMEAKWRRR